VAASSAVTMSRARLAAHPLTVRVAPPLAPQLPRGPETDLGSARTNRNDPGGGPWPSPPFPHGPTVIMT